LAEVYERHIATGIDLCDWCEDAVAIETRVHCVISFVVACEWHIVASGIGAVVNGARVAVIARGQSVCAADTGLAVVYCAWIVVVTVCLLCYGDTHTHRRSISDDLALHFRANNARETTAEWQMLTLAVHVCLYCAWIAIVDARRKWACANRIRWRRWQIHDGSRFRSCSVDTATSLFDTLFRGITTVNRSVSAFAADTAADCADTVTAIVASDTVRLTALVRMPIIERDALSSSYEAAIVETAGSPWAHWIMNAFDSGGV
jgi:hypothetical protein